MNTVSNILTIYLPSKKKTTPSGWISFNAPCCIHNGHSQDSRGRGGLKNNNDSISYHCFNCGFKCSWKTGKTLSWKFKKFLEWIGTPDEVISKLALSLIQQKEDVDQEKKHIIVPTFNLISLPKNSLAVNENRNNIINSYIDQRGLKNSDLKFYWTTESGYRDRLIIPFTFNNDIVGFTARTVKNAKPKYLTNSQPGYVFGIDYQDIKNKFVLVCEGPIDALHVKGTSILGSEISHAQLTLLKSLNKEIIVIPDRDKGGKKLYEQAMDLGLSVSLPNWHHTINDVSEAVNKYGRLLTLYSIIKNKNSNILKIKLRGKQWFV